MLNPIEFYRLTMTNNGIELSSDYNDAKVAEVTGKDEDLVKLAQQIQDQLIVDWYRNEDKLAYDSKAAIWEDSLKIAECYQRYVDEENKRSNHILDRARAKLEKVASEFITDTGMDCEPDDLLKLAALHEVKSSTEEPKAAEVVEEPAKEAETVDVEKASEKAAEDTPAEDGE